MKNRKSVKLLLCIVLAATIVVGSMASSFAALTGYQEAVLLQLAQGNSYTWEAMSAAQAQAMYNKAEAYLNNYYQYHLPYGSNADVWFSDYNKTSIVKYEGLGDSVHYTGQYLTALVFKYIVTGDSTLLTKMNDVIDKIDQLSLVSGRSGYLARYSGLASDPAYQLYYQNAGDSCPAYYGSGIYADQVWLGNSSRDTYTGVGFGLSMAWKGVTNQTVRNKIKTVVERIADRLIADNWWIIDGQGHSTNPTAWFKMQWMRLAIAVNGTKYAGLVSDYESAYSTGMLAPPSLNMSLHNTLYGDTKYNPEYFAYNLDFDRVFPLIFLEFGVNDTKTAAYQKELKKMWNECEDHLNSFFAACYIVGCGDYANNDAKAVLQGCLIDFPDAPRWIHLVDLRNDPTIPKKDSEFSRYALLPRLRVTKDFMWQVSPCVLYGGAETSLEFPGVDVFLPYWMGRYSGTITAP